MANATSGWMPTITVSAPRRRVIIAIPRSERDTNESMTSSDVTSTMIPRERWRVTCAITSSRSCRTSVSVSADWIEAMRNGPCLRIGTATLVPVFVLGSLHLPGDHGVAKEPLGLFDAALEITHGVDLGEIDAQRHEGLRDLRRQARDDHQGTHQ